jgi:hypothetical protein
MSLNKFFFSSTTIPNLVFLPLAIKVIVSNSIYVCIRNIKMDMSEILEIFQVSNVSNITGEGNVGVEGSEVCSSDYIVV